MKKYPKYLVSICWGTIVLGACMILLGTCLLRQANVVNKIAAYRLRQAIVVTKKATQPADFANVVYKIVAPSQNPNETGYDVDYAKLSGKQTEIMAAVYQEFQRADRQLNETYHRIFREYQRNPLFLAKLTIAEQNWISFRDAHLNALYPQDDKKNNYSNVYPICYYLEETHLTWERVNQLNEWLKSYGDGVLGLGSRGSKESDVQ